MKSTFFKISLLSLGFFGTTHITQSCTASQLGQSASFGYQFIKGVLSDGTQQGLNIWSNPSQFVTHQLIDLALPESLKNINSKLTNLGLQSLVTKEKQYIAEAAKVSVEIAKPILSDAISQMTAADAISIISGGKGAATRFLKQKTQTQLIAAIQGRVDSKLNEYGLVKSLNTALNSSSLSGILSSVTGNTNTSATSGLSQMASEQMVNGLFKIVENYENEKRNNSAQLLNNLVK